MARTAPIRISSAWLAALAALATAMALVVAPPAHAAQDALSNLELARAAGVGTTYQALDAERAYAAEETCFADTDDDEIHFESGAGTEAGQARADILNHCVNYGPTLSLHVDVAEPTDPTTDAAWQGATFIGWFIDVDDDTRDIDGEGDYFVEYHLDAEGELVALVRDLAESEDAPPVCTVRPHYTGRYSASGIARTCIGDPAVIQVAVGFFYDTDPEGTDESGVWFDQAPDDGTFSDDVAAGPEQRDTERVHIPGGSRIHTAVAISRRQFPGTVPAVYIARADAFPDALAGGIVTAGPILLVHTTGPVPAIVREEIARLDPERVTALGGTAAISDDVLAEAGQGRRTTRLAGSGRIETALEISRFVFPTSAQEVYLARADNFPDALAGGVLTDGPILLVPRTGEVPAHVRQEIERLDPARVIALGGLAAVAEETLMSAGAGFQTGRLSRPGGGRIQTALEIARYQFPGTAEEVYLARADEFPDALAGGVLTGGPILLVPRTLTRADGTVADFPPDVADEISRLSPERVVALGGPAAVSDEVLNAAAGY